MGINTTTFKTLEDAEDAMDQMEACFTNDAHAIAQWIWDNCGHDDKEAMYDAWLWSKEDSELESLAWGAYCL